MHRIKTAKLRELISHPYILLQICVSLTETTETFSLRQDVFEVKWSMGKENGTNFAHFKIFAPYEEVALLWGYMLTRVHLGKRISWETDISKLLEGEIY